MTQKKFYLAHPILVRKEVREQELKFEAETGIELVNPFYDGWEKKDIEAIDSGKKTVWHQGLKYRRIVENDLHEILKADGLVAFLPFVPTVGTIIELVLAKQFNKEVYIIAEYEPWLSHPWLKYFADVIVSSFDELARYLI